MDFWIFAHENHSKPTREYPYTPRIDRGNTHFQIIKKIFTGLENAFVERDDHENLLNQKNIFYIFT